MSHLKFDRWEAAISRLSHEDRERFGVTKASQQKPHDVLVEVLKAVNEKKDESMKRRWKVVVKGRTIILRDVLEKVSVWVNKLVVRAVADRALLTWY